MAARMQQCGYDTAYFEYTRAATARASRPPNRLHLAFIYTWFAMALM